MGLFFEFGFVNAFGGIFPQIEIYLQSVRGQGIHVKITVVSKLCGAGVQIYHVLLLKNRIYWILKDGVFSFTLTSTEHILDTLI